MWDPDPETFELVAWHRFPAPLRLCDTLMILAFVAGVGSLVCSACAL